MEKPELLVLSGLSRSFGGLHAVDAVDLQLQAGAALGLIGPNGAGKSTLLQLVTGLLPATSGTVTFRGRDVTRLPAEERVRMGMGRGFQHARCFPRLTVSEHLQLAASHLPRTTGVPRQSSFESLRRFGLEAFADRPAHTLSVVQLKLLDLARATCHGPSLLLLDEPFAGAGEHETSHLSAAIESVRAQGTALLVIEHRLSQMVPLVDELAVMVAGRLVARGEPDSVLRDDAVLAAYMGSVRG